MKAKALSAASPARMLILVDESNVVGSIRNLGRNLDWLKLRDFLVEEIPGRELVETAVYVGLPPAMPEWQVEREKKLKFVHWLRAHHFLVVTKDGAPSEGGFYKANVDVLLAVDAVELCADIRPDVLTLVSGDADFGCLALRLRRRGIRVEVASTLANLGSGLKTAANRVVDLGPLFGSFEPIAPVRTEA